MTTPSSLVSVAKIRAALRTVADPELGIDIVSLGLVYGITVQQGSVTVRMTLTTPACPLAPVIAENVRRAVVSLKGVTAVVIDYTFDPPWNPSMMKVSQQPMKRTKVRRMTRTS